LPKFSDLKRSLFPKQEKTPPQRGGRSFWQKKKKKALKGEKREVKGENTYPRRIRDKKKHGIRRKKNLSKRKDSLLHRVTSS